MAHELRGVGLALALYGLSAATAAAQQATPQEPEPAPPAAAAPEAIDPELLRPLTPLEQFELSPPQFTAPAETTTGAVTYRTEIRGLAEVGLERAFRQDSALEDGGGRAASRLQINARIAEDTELAQRLLHTRGYYQAKVDITARPDGGRGRFRVLVTVAPGPQFRFGRIGVTGGDTEPPGLAREALGLQPGEAIIAEDVRAAEANVSLRLPEQGYPFVKVGERDIALDPATALGDYTLPVSPGPKASFGGFQLDEPVFSARHLAVIARFKSGETYDSRKVDDFRRALVATSLFSGVGVEPVDTGRRAADGTAVTDLRVNGGAAPSHTLSGSLGYETGVGIKLEGAWSDLNLFPPEGALTVRGIAGSDQQLLGVQFRRSNAGQRDRTFFAQAQTSRETTEAYNAYGALLQARISRESTPLWQKRWTYSAGVEAEVSSEEAFSLALGRKARRTYKVAGLRLSGGYDRSDSLLNPTRGFTILATLDPESVFGNGSHLFVKSTLEGRVYAPVTSALTLAGRLRVGALFGVDPQQLAPSRRFYEGGGGTVRGFGYQQVGPKAPDGSPLGGASSTDMSLEARYRFGNFGVVTFVDAGQVYQSSTPGFSDLRYGVGIGARYYTNFGPIRFDVATPISRRPGENALGVYISIGQAF